MSYERMVRAEADLDAETRQLRRIAERVLAEAAAVDAAEDELYGADSCGDELPPELQRREDRLAFLRKAKKELEAEAQAAEEARRSEMRAEGREPRQPTTGRDPFAPKPRTQRNFTDPESRIMKTGDGAFHQCFNAQAAVDDFCQVIVAADLSNVAPDARHLPGLLDDLKQNLTSIDAELAGSAGAAGRRRLLQRRQHPDRSRARPGPAAGDGEVQPQRPAARRAARPDPQERDAKATDGPQA